MYQKKKGTSREPRQDSMEASGRQHDAKTKQQKQTNNNIEDDSEHATGCPTKGARV
jgi:hypothetical protein